MFSVNVEILVTCFWLTCNREKVCALFSLLMVNFSVAALSEFGNYINWVSIPCLDSFAGHVQSGLLFSLLSCIA